jgi:hypothetical protein
MCFVHCLYKIGPALFDYNKRLIQLSVIQSSNEHCNSQCSYQMTAERSSGRSDRCSHGNLTAIIAGLNDALLRR